jgi:hemerythrin superfamily protein
MAIIGAMGGVPLLPSAARHSFLYSRLKKSERRKTMKDIGTMIIEDHRVFRKEIHELRHTQDSDMAQREQVLAALMRRLAAHHVGEERTLFPAMLEISKEHDLGQELIEEHKAMEILYSDLVITGYGSNVWVARMRPIMEIHETHMAREESNLIPRLPKIFAKERLEEMAVQFDRYREEEMAKPTFTWRDCRSINEERRKL